MYGAEPNPLSYFETFQDATIYSPHLRMCVTAYRTTEGRTDVQMQHCNPGDRNQQWKFEW